MCDAGKNAASPAHEPRSHLFLAQRAPFVRARTPYTILPLAPELAQPMSTCGTHVYTRGIHKPTSHTFSPALETNLGKEGDTPAIRTSKEGELGYVGIALFRGSSGSSNRRPRLYYVEDKACDAESSWSEKV